MLPVYNRRLRWVGLVVVAIILVVSSLQCAAPERQDPVAGSTTLSNAPERSFGPVPLEPLPMIEFHLRFNDSVVGEMWIDAPIIMKVVEDRSASTGNLLGYMISYSFEYITAFNPLLAPGLLGVGVDWYSYYPYFYNSSGKVYDYWEAGHFEEAGNREWPFWTTTSGEGSDLGDVKPSQLDNGSRYGEYLWLHNIRLYFQDNATVLCSPNDLLLWAEFQWTGANWTISSQIWGSLSKQTIIGFQAANLTVVYPLDPAKTIIIIAVPSLVALIAYTKRNALRGRFHRKSVIGLKGSEYYCH